MMGFILKHKASSLLENMRNIMFCIFFLLSTQIFATAIPPYQGYVTDVSGILSAEQRSQMEQYSTILAEKTGVQVATLVVQDMGGLPIETYANQVFADWKIGNKEDQGILFVVALSEKKLRYEVGYGAEGWLNDGKAGSILDTYVIPLMKSQSPAKAIFQGHLAVIDAAATEFKIDLSISKHKQTAAKPISGDAVLLFVGLLVLLGILTRGRIFPWLLLLLMSSSRGGRGGGGGFGGFGGGSSGGGGASRGW